MYPTKLLVTEEYFADYFAAEVAHIPDLDVRYVASSDLRDEDLHWADSWLGFRFPVRPEETAIHWFHSATDGIEHMHDYYPQLRATGSILTNTVATMPHRMAEYVVAGVLGYVREFPQYQNLQSAGKWERLGNGTAQHMNVVVVGTGHIGSVIAKLMRPFVARVDGLSRSGRARAEFDSVRALSDPGDLLRQADVVVTVLPHTDESINIVGENAFAQMRDVIFVNVGRGSTVDDHALRSALDDGRVRHAILDVFPNEPLEANDWHWTHPQVTVTPHISGLTRRDDIVADFVANLEALRAGTEPPNLIDLDGWY
ncbi:phosphoglycerate dehydrogenase-like enzyme [Arcanobacterium pluranimalium]|uniref:D-2-hydroxyacid dehydrogenase n=1 Tax=Arcanobacterium pluranimalium TaxID=108028 RepID=UPI00195CD448|nr:D-2-hydroxyacid dehydrogenase [Arcanobacterium pluranimalium]MBM7825852.1 phosphoglycerate dehydrogenase-like enzyme [Arcanobacterium pluranimalium]